MFTEKQKAKAHWSFQTTEQQRVESDQNSFFFTFSVENESSAKYNILVSAEIKTKRKQVSFSAENETEIIFSDITQQHSVLPITSAMRTLKYKTNKVNGSQTVR